MLGARSLPRAVFLGSALAIVVAAVVMTPLLWAGGSPASTQDAQPAAAQTSVTLVGKTGKATSGVGSAEFDHAQMFTTGSNSGGYKLTRVQVDFTVLSGTQPGYTMEIWSDSSGSPGSKLHTLTNPASLSSGIHNFDASGTGIDLDASTAYHVMWNVVSSGSNSVGVRNTASDDEDDGKAAGWSIADNSRYRAFNGTGTWSTGNDSRMIAIVGHEKDTTAPTLDSAVVNGTALGLYYNEALDTTSVPALGFAHFQAA